jgi:hypothetical protein
MSQLDPIWGKPAAGQGSADSNQGNEPEFHVVAIGEAIDIQVFEGDGELALERNTQPHPFVVDRAITLRVS